MLQPVSSFWQCIDSSNGRSLSNPNAYEDRVAQNQHASQMASHTPLPAASTRQLSYGISNSRFNDPKVYVPESGSGEYSLERKDKKCGEGAPNGTRQKSILLFLEDLRFYIRAIAILIMIVSLSLILTAVISFAKARKKHGHPLDNVPQAAPITDYPCIVFSGITVMNLVFSLSLLCVSCMSSKVWPNSSSVLIEPCSQFDSSTRVAMPLMQPLLLLVLLDLQAQWVLVTS